MSFSLVYLIRWQDLVDILLNSYILFRLYVLFRGTSVFRLVAGIVMLWLFQRFATGMGLIVTTYVLQAVTAIAALIVIIVFRDEIRSVIQTKNLGTILWSLSPKARPTPLEEVVAAVYELARKRHGGLIVFPGRQDVSDLIQSGLRWQGVISREMLASIFWPDNPVHDGAVLIDGRRIAEVGAILPLSRREDLPSQYGTRHRAAAGLAEASDALVVVVSEETGRVSVARGRAILPIRDNVALLKLLRQHAGFSRRRYRREWGRSLELGTAALVSLLFICAVWMGFARGRYTVTTLEVPVEYMNRQAGVEIMQASVNAVKLTLSGSGTLVKALRPEQVEVRIDLNKAVVGANSFTITEDNVTLPPGVLLESVVPPVVEATLYLPVEMVLPVQVDWVGKLPPELSISDVTVEPPNVAVVGSGEVLKSIGTLYTEKVPLDNIEASGKQTVNLALTSASLKIPPGGKSKVTVSYTVVERKADE